MVAKKWGALFGAPLFFLAGPLLRNYETPEKHLIETMAGGVAAFDYDGDGLVDLFFTNGAPQPSLRKTIPQDCNTLYRNTGAKFVEVKTNLCGTGYDIGAAAADYDHDGRTDLFVVGVRSSSFLMAELAGRAGRPRS